jgi:hypothetical protein
MKIQNDKIYMIRHKPTGLFKAGGNNGNFNKTGKMWLGARIKTHLRMFEENFDYHRIKYGTKESDPLIKKIDATWKKGHYTYPGHQFPIDECEIVEIEFKAVNTQPVREFVEEEMEKK